MDYLKELERLPHDDDCQRGTRNRLYSLPKDCTCTRAKAIKYFTAAQRRLSVIACDLVDLGGVIDRRYARAYEQDKQRIAELDEELTKVTFAHSYALDRIAELEAALSDISHRLEQYRTWGGMNYIWHPSRLKTVWAIARKALEKDDEHGK